MLITFDYASMDCDKIWVWADPHFGHEPIRKMCNRPWNNTDKMDHALIKNANKLVGNNDILITVGDITLAGPTRERYASRIISQFPGRNVLVLGNHDRFKPRWYMKRGFELVATSLILPGGILVTHDPKAASNWPLHKPVICGHVHGMFKSIENVVNVGVDIWDYQPVQIEDAILRCTKSRTPRDWEAISKNRHNIKAGEINPCPQ